MEPSSNLIFFGSGPIAATTLLALHDAGFGFEYIVTKPRVESFRGRVPVVELAEKWDTTILTPANKHELSTAIAAYKPKSRVGLVVDYGIIINQDVIDAFELGIINSHFSLLPEWRGADPITFAILSGQAKTGVSLMRINAKLDEGDLIAQEEYSLPPDTTIGQLTTDLVNLSNCMLVEYLPKYLKGDIQPYPQPKLPATYSRKLTKEDGHLDWHKPAEVLEREIRAYLGWPKSYGQIFGKDVIALKARVANSQEDGDLILPCADNTYLEIQELIAPSGRKMSGADFARGYSNLARSS